MRGVRAVRCLPCPGLRRAPGPGGSTALACLPAAGSHGSLVGPRAPPVDDHVAGLADAVRAVHALGVHGGVPGGVLRAARPSAARAPACMPPARSE